MKKSIRLYISGLVQGIFFRSFVKENAEKYSQSFSKEIHRIIIHGVLHLLGYKDGTSKEKIQMTKKEKSDLIEELFKKGEPIDQALRKGVQDALRRHKQAGNPVCEQRDGKIIWVQPEDIDVDEAK